MNPPSAVACKDPGARPYGTLDGQPVWDICWSPPSGIEREEVVHSDGSPVSDEEFARIRFT